jgi:hypothetical protein
VASICLLRKCVKVVLLCADLRQNGGLGDHLCSILCWDSGRVHMLQTWRALESVHPVCTCSTMSLCMNNKMATGGCVRRGGGSQPAPWPMSRVTGPYRPVQLCCCCQHVLVSALTRGVLLSHSQSDETSLVGSLPPLGVALLSMTGEQRTQRWAIPPHNYPIYSC